MARLFCVGIVVMLLVILINQATSKVPSGRRGGPLKGRGGRRGGSPRGRDGHSGSSSGERDGHSGSSSGERDGHSGSSSGERNGHRGDPPSRVGGGHQGGGRRGGGRGGGGRGGGNKNDDKSETTPRKTTDIGTTTHVPFPTTTPTTDEPYAPVSGCLLPTTETDWNCPEFIVDTAGTYHEHDNCLYFCHCGAADALPNVQTCPDGTVWSPDSKICDLAGYMTCQEDRIVDCPLPTEQTAWDCPAYLANGVYYAAALPDPRFYCQCGSDRLEPHIVQCSAGTVWKQTDGQTSGGCVHDPEN